MSFFSRTWIIVSARPKSLTIFFSFSTLLYMGLGLVESCLSLEKSHNEVHITTFNGRDGDFHNGRLPGRVKQELKVRHKI